MRDHGENGRYWSGKRKDGNYINTPLKYEIIKKLKEKITYRTAQNSLKRNLRY